MQEVYHRFALLRPLPSRNSVDPRNGCVFDWREGWVHEDEYEYEYDGQPDELTEWADYDPDC